MNRYSSLCDDFYVNMNLSTEMELPHSRETVLHFFERIQKKYPTMRNFYCRDRGDFVLEEGSFADDFHVFTFIWEEDAMHWYIDGVHFQTFTEWYTQNVPYPAPFDATFYLQLNLAVGGEWPGNPDETTVFPQQLLVDYVRVYQRGD